MLRRVTELAVIALVVSILNLVGFAVICMGGAAAGPAPCVAGDVNGDGVVDVSDPIALLNHLFAGGPAPIACAAAGTLTLEQEEMLSHMSIVYLDDGQGATNKTIRFTGVNVQVVNGLGATNGYPPNPGSANPLETQINGVGNLIVGYNTSSGELQTGSHNLLVGDGHGVTSYGGAAVGLANRLQSPFTFAAGSQNTASGPYSAVSGGRFNCAAGEYSSVSGGADNNAAGDLASVSGGQLNNASGFAAAVSGGHHNTASGNSSSVAGGASNAATFNWSSVLGGSLNTASGQGACVSGGFQNVALFFEGSVTGGFMNTANEPYSTVSGGRNNVAGAWYSSVSGGDSRVANGQSDWVAGSLSEDF